MWEEGLDRHMTLDMETQQMHDINQGHFALYIAEQFHMVSTSSMSIIACFRQG